MKGIWNEFKDQLLAQTISIGNPLGNATLFSIIESIISGLVVLAIPIVVFMVIYAGFLFVSAQGNVEKLEKAKRAITYALIGALILLGAEAISNLISGTVDSMR